MKRLVAWAGFVSRLPRFGPVKPFALDFADCTKGVEEAMNRTLFVIVASASLLGYSVSAWAGQTATTMNVTLNIGQEQAVVVTAGSLNFTPGTAYAQGSATITVRASAGLEYSIGLDGGLHPDPAAGARGLVAPGIPVTIGYFLSDFSGPRTGPWGQDDAFGSSRPGTGTGADQAYIVSGATQFYSPGQFPDGTYSDVVTVVVIF